MTGFGPGSAIGWAPLGAALLDYHHGATDAELVVASELWEDEPTPVEAFYRPERHGLPALERTALGLCRGRVLDLGAGAGRHALELQKLGHEVVAVDPLPEAVAIMRDRGVTDARCGAIDVAGDEPFDTIVMLMHGVGIVGTLHGLGRLLESLPDHLAPGGRLVFDSADLGAVLRAEAPDLLSEIERPDRYPGEVEFQLRYRGVEGEPYPWLFVDPATLSTLALAAGCRVEIAATAERGAYLAVVTNAAH